MVNGETVARLPSAISGMVDISTRRGTSARIYRTDQTFFAVPLASVTQCRLFVPSLTIFAAVHASTHCRDGVLVSGVTVDSAYARRATREAVSVVVRLMNPA